jgi:hypothetical protein
MTLYDPDGIKREILHRPTLWDWLPTVLRDSS